MTTDQRTLLHPSEPSRSSSDAILVAEDDPLFRRVLQSWLQNWGYKVTAVPNGTEAWQVLQEPTAPPLLILDWLMPGMDGPELCRRIRQRQRTLYQYILLVTSKDDKQDVVCGLESGADDYLTKPFDTGELNARLRVGKRILALQDELIQAREDLRFQATHDALTGLYSRGAILELLEHEVQRGFRSRISIGVAMIDIDHFKQVNDTYGHVNGDAVLKEVANRISQAVRTYDFVGRYGGEEFLVVLSDCDAAALPAVAERIRLSVAGQPVTTSDRSIPATVSVGGVTSASGMGEMGLISAADSALYEAKRKGRNRVEIASARR